MILKNVDFSFKTQWAPFGKQAVALALAFTLGGSSSLLGFANKTPANTAFIPKLAQQATHAPFKRATSAVLAPQLETQLKKSIVALYPSQNPDAIYQRVLEKITLARKTRPAALLEEDLIRPSDWYKDEVVYMFYADRFGAQINGKNTTFQDAIGMLDYLKTLGVTTLYVLPFMDSPMSDAGFDIRDPKKIREDLGGDTAFAAFQKAAHQKGFKLKADLILNHFSDQHQWFQEALKGDLQKRDYFVYRMSPPVYKSYRDPQKGNMVDYLELDGKISSRRLIFPDFVDNHYRKETISGKDTYFYHTFYPFQLDINWENPNVLYEILDILTFWTHKGVDIFRLDAIPYYIKEAGTDGENLPRTHQVIKLLSTYLQATAPRTIVQAEACQWPKDILPYFGEEHRYMNRLGNAQKQMTRTDEVQIAYNFPYMPAIWASLITADNQHFWKAFDKTPEIPASASWASFLRVHDELTLEMVDIDTRKLVFEALLPKGAEFRKGLGVSGRMANFLNEDPRRILLAQSILLSLPGMPIIYYGDEMGATNDWAFAKEFAVQRELQEKKNNPQSSLTNFMDTRDINRGIITKQAFYDSMQSTSTTPGKIFHGMQQLISARKQSPIMTRGKLVKLDSSNPSVFCYLRTLNQQQVAVIHNLSGQETQYQLVVANKILKDKPLVDLKTGQKIIPFNTSPSSVSAGVTIPLQPYQSYWLAL